MPLFIFSSDMSNSKSSLEDGGTRTHACTLVRVSTGALRSQSVRSFSGKSQAFVSLLLWMLGSNYGPARPPPSLQAEFLCATALTVLEFAL